MTSRKIALVTTSRADYGIQSHLARILQDDAEVDLSLVVSGTHLSPRHGMTVREIEADGLRIASQVDIGIDSEPDVPHMMAKAVVSFSKTLQDIQPEICILLGDRFEMMSAAMACTLCRVPIAHLHGGETTEGAVDEVFRHSITKAAWLHFTACEEYRRRVVQLGESPDRVFNVGALGVENIRRARLLPRGELSDRLGIPIAERLFLVAFHPETASGDVGVSHVDEILCALDKFPDVTVLFTRPNADTGGDAIANRFRRYVEVRDNAFMFDSLGMTRYLSAVKVADAVIGNSSSGVIEAPSLRTPTVNVGDRQKGRIHAASVIDCPAERNAVLSAISNAVAMSESGEDALFRNPYESENTSERIATLVKAADLSGATKKKFYDLSAVDDVRERDVP